MNPYLLYLLKVAVAIAVFYAVFHLLLQNRKQFVFNRAYLLFSFAASFLIPLITFKTELVLSAGPLDLTSVIFKAAEPLEPSSPSESNFTYNHLLLIFYLVGVGLFLSKLAYAFLRAKSIISHCEKAQIEGWSLLVSPEKIRAFTFLDKIIIGSNIVDHPSLPMILHHESVHAREKHAYDILASEMLFALQWFNPFAYLYKNAIKINLEFRADQLVVAGHNAEKYQLTMLEMVQNRVVLPMFTELNSSNLKKRIAMMKMKNTQHFAGLAKFAIVPVFAVLLLSLSNKEAALAQPASSSGKAQEKNTALELESVEDVLRYMAQNIRYPGDAMETGTTGSTAIFVSINADGRIDKLSETPWGEDFIALDEVVVVGYNKTGDGPVTESADYKGFSEEAQRLAQAFPKLSIPEWYGKDLKIQLKFILQ